jgi:hypothetical protein
MCVANNLYVQWMNFRITKDDDHIYKYLLAAEVVKDVYAGVSCRAVLMGACFT